MPRACAGLGPNPLAGPWLILAYSISLFPLGAGLIGAVLVSIPQYVWRASYPLKAKRYNRHAGIAFALWCPFWGGLVALSILGKSVR